jgi:hypothetical protein
MDWTDQDARAWAKTWDEPHMVKGLRFIQKRVRPKRSSSPVAQGFDLSPVFIKSAGFYEGSQEVMDLIETLGYGQVNKPKFDLPEPFSHITSEEQTKQ